MGASTPFDPLSTLCPGAAPFDAGTTVLCPAGAPFDAGTTDLCPATAFGAGCGAGGAA